MKEAVNPLNFRTLFIICLSSLLLILWLLVYDSEVFRNLYSNNRSQYGACSHCREEEHFESNTQGRNVDQNLKAIRGELASYVKEIKRIGLHALKAETAHPTLIKRPEISLHAPDERLPWKARKFFIRNNRAFPEKS